jgi:hypothetical protein
MSSSGLRLLESLHPKIRRPRLVRRHYTRQDHLHGDCFYAGREPIDETERLIRETAGCIDDAEGLASAEPLDPQPSTVRRFPGNAYLSFCCCPVITST